MADDVFRRPLNKRDLERMNLPARFWESRLEAVTDEKAPDGSSLKGMVFKYLENFEEMIGRGAGLMIWGINGIGKTCGAAVLAMEARRRGHSVLFVTAAEFIESVRLRHVFDDVQSMAERAKNVDLLVVDDFGKEYSDGRGLRDRLFEDLFRYRSSHLKSTVVTMNMSLDLFIKSCEENNLGSMVQVMKEVMVPVHVMGQDRREEAGRELRDILVS